MTLARIASAAFQGLDSLPAEVEVDTSPSTDKSTFTLVGLPDAAVREAKDRVLAAVRNSNYSISQIHCTINLAPAHLKKEGVLYDLPIACGLLRSIGVITTSHHNDYLMVGELGLSGELRPIHGAIATALLARKMGKKGLLLPAANAAEAAAVPGIAVIPIATLKEAATFLNDPRSIQPTPSSVSLDLFAVSKPPVDLADIKGQENAKRALEIAASGGHNILMSGPPGSGKSMMAKALIGIMPELTVEEALEATKIHSISGTLKPDQGLVTQRPFRSPHHTVSYAGLIGGGSSPRPGEVSLAHNGVLFLDELPEFSRTVLEVLRQPLEDRVVTISRAQGNFTFPTSFLCIAAMNPCPCGNRGHPDKLCRCTGREVDRYRGKISGPLLDRIDLHLDIPPLRYQEMVGSAPGEPSDQVRDRVKAARARQTLRFGTTFSNAQMSPRQVRSICKLNGACQEILREAFDEKGISARAHDRILRVARTIADLDEAAEIDLEHLMEAIHYRTGIQEEQGALSY